MCGGGDGAPCCHSGVCFLPSGWCVVVVVMVLSDDTLVYVFWLVCGGGGVGGGGALCRHTVVCVHPSGWCVVVVMMLSADTLVSVFSLLVEWTLHGLFYLASVSGQGTCEFDNLFPFYYFKHERTYIG